MKESTAFRPSRGFTLIELLVVIAIVAILAAILFPVFAQAKLSAKTTNVSSALHQIGSASLMYANDYDQGVVLACQGQTAAGIDRTWSVLLKLYTKSRDVFFDPSRPIDVQDKVEILPGSSLPWYQATTFAINNRGYSGVQPTVTGTCGGRVVSNSYLWGSRNMGSMIEPEKRVAFAPNTIYNPDRGFYFFNGDDASQYDMRSTYTATKIWNNQVYMTRGNYEAMAIPTVHADGSIGKLRAKDFVDKSKTTAAAWCKWLNDGENRVWGSAWLPS